MRGVQFYFIFVYLLIGIEASQWLSYTGPLFVLRRSDNEVLNKECGYLVGNGKKGAGGKFPKKFIVGNGREASLGQFPWSVVLMAPGQQFAGGTIISKRHVVTAAHSLFQWSEGPALPCKGLTPQPVDDLTVTTGIACNPQSQNCQATLQQTYNIVNYAVLNAYLNGGCQNGNDLAIVEVDRDIEFDENTQPICLPSIPDEKDVFKGIDKVYSSGYGLGEDNAFSHKLHFFRTIIRGFTNNDTFHSESTNGKSRICPGDSGSGVIGHLKGQDRYVLLGAHADMTINCEVNPSQDSPKTSYTSTSIQYHLQDICEAINLCT